ncbi:baseplate J/gp47 family protein [Megasphaera sueciensis]|uniref:baseplate J/gp47 family protein n=1 Tax=Megasphaera sueciensis TaxID=349094 RepID=UPI003D07EE5E
MAYTAPYIDETGIHIPTYDDILQDMIAQMKQIYGDDIYLEEDSQDYQMLSIFAAKEHDTQNMLLIVYNNRSPKTAVGSGLDGIVKLNGIRRNAAGYSTCEVELTGTSGTVIPAGVVTDQAGYKWDLPTELTLTGTTIQTTVTCETIGAIQAPIGTITTISTPQKGWTAVTNPSAAITGQPVETNAQLRLRQSNSVAAPSQNMVDSIIAGIVGISGVTRYRVYNNDSGSVDSNGIPSHSIAAVVEGGTDDAIAAQLFSRKGPGCGTFGSSSKSYTQSDGTQNIVKFSRPTYIPIAININIKPNATYTSAVGDNIKSYITSYMEVLGIGDDISVTGIIATVLQALSDTYSPSFSLQSVQLSASGGALASSDISIAYNQVAQLSSVAITEVSS